jgi:hypothetical protein
MITALAGLVAALSCVVPIEFIEPAVEWVVRSGKLG